MSDEKIIDKYSEFLRGKRAILVGPSYHLKRTKQYNLIESYDIVIRMNVGFRFSEKLKKDIGERTDILYSSLSDYFFRNKIFTKKTVGEFRKKYKCKWIIGTGHHRGNMAILTSKIKKSDKNKLLTRLISREDFNFLNNKTNKKLTTGIVTISDLLKFNISELYVIGLNFYNVSITKKRRMYYSGYYKDDLYRYGKVSGAHNLKKELLMFIEWYNKDKRIKCEKPLIELMKKYKRDMREN